MDRINMYHKLTFILVLVSLFLSTSMLAQYEFSDLSRTDYSGIKNQQKTGTCWSFATASFLESEILRQSGRSVDLSEMFIVKKIYEDKAMNYVLRQGKTQFGQGSLSHDLMRVVKNKGIVPQEAFTGLQKGMEYYDHSEMAGILENMLEAVVEQDHPSDYWMNAYRSVLDAYLGTAPESFVYKGVEYTPSSFAENLGLEYMEYKQITSFTHHPFYESFILEIPDNYSNGSYQNMPIEDLIKITEQAVMKGFSVAWDGDVSEKGFSAKNGMAVLPKDPRREDLFEHPGEERSVSQADRQDAFLDYQTTDDHLMHIVGLATDKLGNKYFIVKNSWGKIGPHDGLIYMSYPYFKMKTISILLHREGIPEEQAQKIGIETPEE